MPIFEYRCRLCGSLTELLQGVGRGEMSLQCRSCGGKDLTRIISAPFIKGKGSNEGAGLGQKCGVEENPSGVWPTNDNYIRIKDS